MRKLIMLGLAAQTLGSAAGAVSAQPRPMGDRDRDGLRRLKAGDMGDQRIEGRAALGGIDRRHGGGVGGVRRQAVDGLGRQDDQPTVR